MVGDEFVVYRVGDRTRTVSRGASVERRQRRRGELAALWAFVKATDDYMRLINRKDDIRAASEAAERVLHAREKLRYYESEGDQ